MTETTAAPRHFVAGCDYPSPVKQVIGLGYYDGVTNGVLRTSGGLAYVFDLVGESEGSDDAADLRKFELKTLPNDSFDVIVTALSPYHVPEWPVWIPLWEFPDQDSRAAVDEVIRSELRRASAPAWVIEAGDITSQVVGAVALDAAKSTDDQRRYCALLIDSDDLQRSGHGRAPEGIRVQDEMRAIWPRLDAPARARLTGLAADLRQLAQGGPRTKEMSEAELRAYREQMSGAWQQHKAGDHDAALDALRGIHPVGHVPSSAILFLQARAWSESGLPEAALAFLKAAEREDPGVLVFTLMALRELGRDEEAVAYSARILREQPDDVHACYQACATVAGRARGGAEAKAASQLGEIVLHLRRLRKRLERHPVEEHLLPGVGVGVGCLLGLVLEELGDVPGARGAYDWVSARYPNDPDAWAMRGVLTLWTRDEATALADFQRAVSLGARSATPYLFVAKACLAQGRPAEALRITNRAEGTLGQFDGPLGAALAEVRAIAKSELHQSPARVLEDYDLAIRLQPDNLELRNHREAIAASGSRVSPVVIPLELLRSEQRNALRERSLKADQRREVASMTFLKQSA